MDLVSVNPAPGEKPAIEAVTEMTIGACRKEGLSREQADCILAAAGEHWDAQLRACPAFAAKPPSWVWAGQPR